jgi:hypothetical protein
VHGEVSEVCRSGAALMNCQRRSSSELVRGLTVWR